MPLQNRVTPLGELIADPARGLVYGNRGCLHDEMGHIRRRYNGKRWIAWTELHPGPAGADAVDAQLHAERVAPDTRARRLHAAPFDGLPDGAFVVDEGDPWLVLGPELLCWTPAGYAERKPRPAGGQASLITPPSFVAILRTGWQPLVPHLHPSAAPESSAMSIPSSRAK